MATQHAALDAADAAQEKFKRERGVETRARIVAFNALYDILLGVAQAARLAYLDDPTRSGKYQLPRPVSNLSTSEPPLPEAELDDEPEPEVIPAV